MDYKIKPSYQAGLKKIKEKYSADKVDMLSNIYEFSPDLADVIVSHGIEDIWGQKTASFTVQEKELAVVASLLTLGGCSEELETHIYNALKTGWSKQQIKELLILLTLYIGIPKIISIIPSVIAAFQKFDDPL